jgi:hypothetical protein
MWENRPYKSLMRIIVVTAPYTDVYLTLPSDELRDIYEALERKTINRNTFIIAIEKDATKAKKIDIQLKKLFKHYYLHQGPLDTLDLNKVLNGKKIKLAFFDLCGQITADVANWFIRLNGDEFAENAQVSYTFHQSYRSNDLMQAILPENFNALPPRGIKIIRAVDLCPQVTLSQFNFKNMMHAGKGLISHKLFKTLYALTGMISANYSFTINAIHEYHDTRAPMVFIHTTIHRKNYFANNSISKYVRSICNKLCHVKEEILSRDETRAKVMALIKSLGVEDKTFVERPLKEKVVTKDWQLLKCPVELSSGKKTAAVRAAKDGSRPSWLSPQQWAWNPLNPHRMKKVA